MAMDVAVADDEDADSEGEVEDEVADEDGGNANHDHDHDHAGGALIAALVAQRAASVEQEGRLLGALRSAAALLTTHAPATGDDPRG